MLVGTQDASQSHAHHHQIFKALQLLACSGTQPHVRDAPTWSHACSSHLKQAGAIMQWFAQATNLTAAPSAAPAPSCLDYNISQVAPVANAQTFYSLTIDLQPCFYGQVSLCVSVAGQRAEAVALAEHASLSAYQAAMMIQGIRYGTQLSQ